jgi:hypothetical protein
VLRGVDELPANPKGGTIVKTTAPELAADAAGEFLAN